MLEKETIKQVALVASFAAGMIGLGYAFSPNLSQQELQENYAFCTKLVNKASGDNVIINFVYNQVSIPEGLYAGKTCRQIIEEYQAREHK